MSWDARKRRWPNSTVSSPPNLIMPEPGSIAPAASGAWTVWMRRWKSYAHALAIDPDQPQALESRSNLVWTRHQALAPAIADLERALKASPDLPYAAGNLLQLKMYAGDWRDFAREKARLDEAVRAGKPAAQPFVYQGLFDSPADLLACARIYAAREYPAIAPARRPDARREGRIRLGYLCGEFRARPPCIWRRACSRITTVRVSRFFAFDNSRDDNSPMQGRGVISGFEQIHFPSPRCPTAMPLPASRPRRWIF